MTATKARQRTKAKPTDAYHHGDLRGALIGAARAALEKNGPETIVLKDLAILLRVSQSAPYRHFANRGALLQALAADGFEDFRKTLATAGADSTYEQAFERIAIAYIRFGQTNRGVYRLMFSSRNLCGAKENSPLAMASSAAFDDLLQRVSTHAPAQRVRAVATWIWSTLHGVVMLDSEGLLGSGGKGNASSIEDIVRELAEAVRARLSVSPAKSQASRKRAGN